MSTREVTVCDCCDGEIKTNKDNYHIYLQTDRFWDGVEMDYLRENVDICGVCALSFKTVLIALQKKAQS